MSSDTSTLKSPLPAVLRRPDPGRHTRLADLSLTGAETGHPPRLLLALAIYGGAATIAALALGTWLAHRHLGETAALAVVVASALLALYAVFCLLLRRVAGTLEARNRELAHHAESLFESEEQYRLIVEFAVGGLALLDSEGTIVFANGKLAELLGRPTSALPGTELVQLMDEHSRAAADPRWFRRRHELGEFAFVRPNGDVVHTGVSTNPMFDVDGAFGGALVLVSDRTEDKRAEQALNGVEAKLGASAVRRETQQAAAIARDFDRTLTEVTGYADYLLNRLDPGDPFFREVTQLRVAAEGIVPLMRQLLAISRRESFRSGEVDLATVLSSLEERFPDIVGEGIAVSVSADSSLGRFEADPAQIEQMLVNLLLWARHAMHDRGRIEIEAGNVDLDESFAQDHFPMEPGGYVLLSVVDDGPGLDDEERERLFDPLFAGENEDAAGQGLATVYGIVKQSEGFIWAENARFGGTAFRIYLPRVS